MAFILKSRFYFNFLGNSRRANLTCLRKQGALLNRERLIKFNNIQSRALVAQIKPNPVDQFNIDGNINTLHNGLKGQMVSLRRVEETFRLLKNSRDSFTSVNLMLLLKCCGSAAFKDPEEYRMQLVNEIWDTARKKGIEVDITQYNTLLAVFVENSYKFSPSQMLEEIRANNLEPNKVTKKLLLKAYCQQGDIEGAGKFLEMLKLNNYLISEYDFCSLIQGHCEAGQLEEAERIIKVMKERGIAPTAEPYVYLLCGYAKYGKIDEMDRVMQEMQDQNIVITDSYLLSVAYTLIINDQDKHVDHILNKMTKSNLYERTLVKIVHRLLHKRKDDQAMKLLKILEEINPTNDFFRNHTNTVIEHFLSYRRAHEVSDICAKIEQEGLSTLAFSHALKKAIMNMDLDYCGQLMYRAQNRDFPIRTHYFWPLIVRYSAEGNKGVISVLKIMQKFFTNCCFNTVNVFIRNYYHFSGDWKADIELLKKYGIKECHLTLVAFNETCKKGSLAEAEKIVYSYGIFKPFRHSLRLLVQCFLKSCPEEAERFTHILYGVAHDSYVYRKELTSDFGSFDGEEEELNELDVYFEAVFELLVPKCTKEDLVRVLQSASPKKMIISPKAAALIRETFPEPEVDALVRDFTESNEFELDKELLDMKYQNALVSFSPDDSCGLIRLTNAGDLRAEEMWKNLGREPTIGEHLAMMYLYIKLEQYDKAFGILEGMKKVEGSYNLDPVLSKKFRVILHLMQKSGNLEKVIETYDLGVRLQLISETNILPILRMILNNVEPKVAIEKYAPLFKHVRTIRGFLNVMELVIPTKNTEAIKELAEILCEDMDKNHAKTALFVSYMSNGCYEEARKFLEDEPFAFKHAIFLHWFKDELDSAGKSFEDTVEILKHLSTVDRTPIYKYMLTKYNKSGDKDKLKALWLHCQEENVNDTLFLDDFGDSTADGKKELPSGMPGFSEEQQFRFGSSDGSSQPDVAYKNLMAKKQTQGAALHMFLVLSNAGRVSQIVEAMQTHKYWRFIPDVAQRLLVKNKVPEFTEFIWELLKSNRFYNVCSTLVDQYATIANIAEENEKFFQELKSMTIQYGNEDKLYPMISFTIGLCLELPGKLSEAEELVGSVSEGALDHLCNTVLSNMLLGSTPNREVGHRVCENILKSEKMKSVFSKSLCFFYDRIISFHLKNSDVDSALSYLEKAKADGVEEKLNKELIASVKKTLEMNGSSFPYPELLKEAA